MSTDKDVMAQLTAVAQQDVANKTNFIFDALVVEREPTAMLPENVFVHHFLPYFSGEKPITKESKVVENWVAISGTPTNEVTIVDESGQALFNVPAMYDTNVLDVTTRNVGESMSDIYSGFQQRKNNLPVVAHRYLADALNEKLQVVSKPTQQTQTQQRWQAIMERYGKEPKVSQGSAQNGNGNGIAGDDDVVYD